MATIENIKERGHLARIECTNCEYTKRLDAYIENHPDRVNEDEEIIEMGCPECGHDTVSAVPSERAKEKWRGTATPEALVVQGIEEMERLFGE